jgi:hypothetical protein
MASNLRWFDSFVIALAVIGSGAVIDASATRARAQAEHWESAVNSDCGSNGLACALEHLLSFGGPVAKCYYGHNLDGQVSAAWCEKPDQFTAGATPKSPFCDPDYDVTGTGCSNENEKNRSCGEEANPVNAKVGVKVETVTDFTTEGSAPLAFTRTYWSAIHFWAGPAADQARLGRGWRCRQACTHMPRAIR